MDDEPRVALRATLGLGIESRWDSGDVGFASKAHAKSKLWTQVGKPAQKDEGDRHPRAVAFAFTPLLPSLQDGATVARLPRGCYRGEN